LLSLQGGIKLPTARVTAGGLPQNYQTGLGTTDLLFGIHAQVDAWGFTLAYQLAGGRSKNPVTRLQRGDDLLVKAGYTAYVGQLGITMEAFGIKRLQESNILTSSPGQPETFGDLPDSDQAQINLVASLAHPLNESVGINGFLAIPTLKRNINVDGLTRSIAASLGLSVSL
jgi:hypothetical protein